MNKLIIIAAIVILVIIVIVVVLLSGSSDPWVGNWAGRGGPNDRTTITGKPGNYSFYNTVTKERLNLNISGNVISGYGNHGVRTGNTIRFTNVDNVWTKI